MTRAQSISLKQAGTTCNVKVELISSGTERFEARINGSKPVNSFNKAMDKVTSLYLKANK